MRHKLGKESKLPNKESPGVSPKFSGADSDIGEDQIEI
jgi:hypothetical protein